MMAMHAKSSIGAGATLLALVLAFGWAPTPVRAATMSVGMRTLFENTSDQLIEFLVTSAAGDQTAGLNFNIQIGDGQTGPQITAVDLLGPSTLFGANNTGLGGTGSFQSAGYGGLWESTTTTNPGGLLVPDGVLAVVTVDTTGFFEADGPFDLVLSNTLNGPTDFGVAPPSAPNTTLTVTDGQIALAIPEPTSGLVLGLLAGVGLAVRRSVRRQARRR